jgi:hypothetical protein
VAKQLRIEYTNIYKIEAKEEKEVKETHKREHRLDGPKKLHSFPSICLAQISIFQDYPKVVMVGSSYVGARGTL